MESNEPPSLPTIMASLQARVTEALHANGLYKITAYGWRDAETVDSEFVGHALWQTDPPFEADWTAMFSGGVPQRTPTDRDEQLMMNGDDFTGAMLFAWQAFGLALCTAWSNNVTDDEAGGFWFYVATSLLWLGIASDRIREYFLVAMFSMGSSGYFSNHSSQQWASPFTEACTDARNAAEEILLAALEPLGRLMQEHRKKRHKIIHQMATHAASRNREILRDQRQHGTAQVPFPNPDDLPFEDLIAARPADVEQDERQSVIEQTKLWYDCLAQASNIIFQIEHARRKSPRQGT
jgi:hypothetical protein